MGWSKGKGLGLKEDGEQNFIRVSHKTDQKGMGYQDRDDQWTGHESEFTTLLESLHNSRNASDDDGDDDGEKQSDDGVDGVRSGFGFDSGDKKQKKSKSIKEKLSGKSLEELSKKSSVRVHYRKFTRGKDISRYSEKDLANIFGKKCVNGHVVEKLVEDPIEEMNTADNNYGITIIETGTSIQDYFKLKKQHNENGLGTEQTDPPTEEPEKKQRKKHKETKSDRTMDDTSEAVEVGEMQPVKKQKKKKKSKEKEMAHEIVISDENSDCDFVSVKMSKKKKKSKKNAVESQVDECEPLQAIETSVIDADSVDVVENVPKKKKRSKKRSSETLADESQEVNPNVTTAVANTQFIDSILSIIVNNKSNSVHSSTALKQSNAAHDDTDTTPTLRTQINIAMDETFEINRYHAEMFRFVDLDGFPNANLSELCGYGYGKEIELKITEKSKDQTKINDLWDYALINKYGKEVIQAKKAKRYSIKQLKKKNLFAKL